MSATEDTAWTLDRDARELRRGGRRVRLQGQTFALLQALLERPGEVVTRDELQRRLWPDDAFVDCEHGLNAAVRRLRTALDDDARAQRLLQTLPRNGYRLLWPQPAGGRRRETGPVRPAARLVVQAFRCLSDEPGGEMFSAGLTDEVVSRMAHRRERGIRVIGPCLSSAPTAGQAGSTGTHDDVHYLLEGTVKKDGPRVRITARLLDARDCTYRWSDAYDCRLAGDGATANRLSAQIDVASRLIESVTTVLRTEGLRPAPPAPGRCGGTGAE